jgi:hypothetical protein
MVGNEMRVSDAEREAAAAELQEHFASGRLNQDELNERVAAAFAAKTRGDLNTIFTDLPSSGHGWTSASGPFGSDGARVGERDPWAHPSTAGAQSGWQAGDNAGRASAGRSIGRLVFASVMIWVLFITGILGIFGIGSGRPFGIVLLVAAFALLRRLLLTIFGRRRARGGRGRGPRRRR